MKRTTVRSEDRGPHILTREYRDANLPILSEVLFAAELVLLHAAPIYYGLGATHGDGSGVVLIPAFLLPDHYLFPLRKWLGRIGYEAFFSGINIDAECPNLLIKRCLNESIEKALAKTGRRIHLIGRSLGGVIARSIAGQRPQDIASVITLGAPFRGTVAHSSILRAAETVRLRILKEHGPGVLPACYTGHCTCDFVDSLQRTLPPSVLETAVYTPDDGVVDWRYCRTDNQKPISKFQAPTSDWPLILRYTPSSPTVWLKHIAHRTHRISAGRGVVVSRHWALWSASRRIDLPSHSISGAARDCARITADSTAILL